MKKILSIITLLAFALAAFAQSDVFVLTSSDSGLKSEELTRGSLKVQFEYPIPTNGTIGIASDGEFFYITRHNSSVWTKLNFDGTQVGNDFTVSGISGGLMSLTYDGRYFWGANQTAILYKIDMQATPPVLASTVTSPVKALRCTYDPTANDGSGGFWVGDGSSDLVLIDKTGKRLATIPAATHGLTGIIGSVVDNVSPGGPYLWGQQSTRDNPVILKQIKLPEGTPTGNNYDLTAAGFASTGNGGGLCIIENMIEGTTTLVSLIQHSKIVGFDIRELQTYPHDVGITSIDLPITFPKGEPFFISGKAKNWGTSTINHFHINYQIDDDAVESYEVTGLNLNQGEEYTFACSKAITPVPGSHAIKVWTSQPNGEEDGDTYNDDVSLVYTIYDPDKTVPRTVLLEGFTASTCSPCVAGNNNLKDVLEQNTGSYALIKYQLDFPGSGDPYYTAEGGKRSSLYEILSVPTLVADGTYSVNTSSFSNTILNELQAKAAFIDMEATFYVENKTVSATAKINPTINLSDPDIKLFMTVVEKSTTKNTGTNGEKEFNQVMKKFMPDADGIVLGTLKANTVASFHQSWEFQGNYRLPANASSPINHATEHSIENFDNLQVIAWLQNIKTNELYQACVGIQTDGMVIYEVTGGNGTLTATVDGNLVGSGAYLEADMEIKFEAIPDENYAVKEWKVNGTVVEGNTANELITVTDGSRLNVTVEFQHTGSEGIALGLSSHIKLYPNPVYNDLKISNIKNINKIVISSLSGRIVKEYDNGNDELTISMSNLVNGIYLIALYSADGNKITYKVIKE